MASIQNFFMKLFIKRNIDKKRQIGAPVKGIRKGIDKMADMAKLHKGVKIETVDIDGLAAEWSTPNTLKNEGVILYSHGGGYVAGSLRTHRGIAGRIAHASKTKLLSIDYRLAPENPFPAGLDDAVKAYHWLIAQGYSPNKIVLAGDSAGGGITAATALKLKDKNSSLPAALVLLSPWLDLECSGNSSVSLADEDPMVVPGALREMGLMYTTKENLKTPLASPIYADLKGFPPTFIHVSSSEVLYDDSTRFEKKLKEAGAQVEMESWKGMMHVWQMFAPFLPEANKSIKKIGAFIETKTA